MKKIVLISVFIMSKTFFISCSEDFSPYGEFIQQYSLNCIIKIDSTRHIATFSRSYDVRDSDPNDITFDPFISGASIQLIYRDSTYTLKDTVIQRTDTSRFKFDQKAYYVDGLKPASPNQIEIRAITPDGKILSSKINLVPSQYITNSPAFLGVNDNMSFQWQPYIEGLWHLPRLLIVYTKLDESPGRIYKVEVPTTFINNAPYYPVLSRMTGVTFLKETIEYEMRKISENDPLKNNYKFFYLTFELLTFDEYLSSYITLAGGFDELSIRLDEINYTNIKGGYGIFGSYKKQTRNVTFDRDYLTYLGYTP